MNVTILLPVYNNKKKIFSNINYLLSKLEKTNFNYEIIIINDGSTDQTLEEIQKIKSEKVKYDTYKKNMGKGYAIKKGIKIAKFENILFTDSDLAYPPSEIINIINKYFEFETKKIIIANRRHPKSKFILSYDYIKYVYSRELIGRAFNRLLKKLNLTSFEDTQAGLKIFPKKMSFLEKIKSNDFLYDIEFLHYAKREKIEIIDCPITYIYHDTTTSTSIIKGGFLVLFKVLKIFLRLRNE